MWVIRSFKIRPVFSFISPNFDNTLSISFSTAKQASIFTFLHTVTVRTVNCQPPENKKSPYSRDNCWLHTLIITFRLILLPNLYFITTRQRQTRNFNKIGFARGVVTQPESENQFYQ
jgi:hypothetical protein